MEGVPSAEDHLRVTILVKQIGPRNNTAFNRIVERLARQEAIQVSDNPRRIFLANFVTSVSPELVKFGELQAHRRVYGLIAVACGQPSTSTGNTSFTSPKTSVSSPEELRPITERRRSSLNGNTVEEIRSNYDKIKGDYSSTLVDSRCVLVGYDEAEVAASFSQRETFQFSRLEESEDLETGVREFLRAIYFVLESKRVDVSFEKQDTPSCPILPEEEKFRIGLEVKTSKTYKRKCIGRARKQHADFTMLTGLPQLALEAYQASIDMLKSSNDLLWLAGACEGWACAAMALRLEISGESITRGMQRVASMTPQEIREAQMDTSRFNGSATATSPGVGNQHLLGVSTGHQRHRSDENAVATMNKSMSNGNGGGATGGGTPGINTTNGGDAEGIRRKSRLPWGGLRSDRSDRRIESAAIMEKFEMALENYSKFSFAALIEYDCMMKAVSVHRYQRQYIEMETFHRDHVGKYLDDSFTRFDHYTKSIICNNSAALYKEIGFHRKCAFFARLGVLFRLHVTENESRTLADYRSVYPILYRTLPGYGIVENARETPLNTTVKGPVQMQIKALHEVYTAAMRAELFDAAIRHLCHLIQVYYEEMDHSLANRLFDDLQNLVQRKGSAPQLNQRLSVGLGNIILSSIQLTRFPMISEPELCSLPPHLTPTVLRTNDGKPAIFIYSPFQAKAQTNSTYWVVDCACEVSVLVYNCRDVELVVRELCLLADGCVFEAVPVRLILPAKGDDIVPSRIKLIGVPRTSGKLTITGYSCEVFGVKNVCKLTKGNNGLLQVDVLPSLGLLQLESSLPRAPIEQEQHEPSSETTVYSGQLFHHSLTVVNTSPNISIRKARLQVWQPKVSGGPSLIEIMKGTPEEEINRNDDLSQLLPDEFRLEPGERKEIHFNIFGIDPTATADDELGEDKVQIVETALPLVNALAEQVDGDEGHDLIPYIGRLLSCQFVFTYESDVMGVEGERYERSARHALAVSIVPALTVSAWHILPGDGPFTRYIVVDVTNSTDHDAELVYSGCRRMNVLPKETCRVPLLSPCCSEVAGRAFFAAAQKDSHMMQRMEVEKLRRTLERHVAKHLDIRWTIPAMELEGLVPVGALLSSVSLLKQLVLPAISLDLSVNGVPYLSEDDLSVGIGEVVTLKVAVISSLDYDFEGVLTVECYQEISQQFGVTSRKDNLLVLGARRVPFVVPKMMKDSELPAPRCEVDFSLLFRVEGIHKLRPQIASRRTDESLLSDEIFVSPVGFNVTTTNNGGHTKTRL